MNVDVQNESMSPQILIQRTILAYKISKCYGSVKSFLLSVDENGRKYRMSTIEVNIRWSYFPNRFQRIRMTPRSFWLLADPRCASGHSTAIDNCDTPHVSWLILNGVILNGVRGRFINIDGAT